LRGLGRQKELRVYCIDDKNARFLDDALSVEVLKPGQLVRVYVHVADVDETVRSGSAMDELAKERGQSLYLPLKPLHMLPAAAMDAASFSTAFPTEGITAVVDLDVAGQRIVSWEIFASLVPPVTRVNYDQFDAALEGRDRASFLSAEIRQDLKCLGTVAPLLAERLDTRRSGRKQRRSGSGVNGQTETSSMSGVKEGAGIASVRLVKRRENGAPGGSVKYAQVVNFRSTGGYAVVSDMLLSVSALFRLFARRHGAFLPEDRGASMHVTRCGTAPMRRYADLAIQRQIKCILFGRQPAGRRRMDELRAWLAKRHAASEKTVTVRRRAALYASLADHCAQQQQAANLPYATLMACVRSVSVTRRRVVKADIGIDGTGLHTLAVVADSLVGDSLQRLEARSLLSDPNMNIGLPLKGGDRVQIRISEVDTVAEKIVAEVVAKVD
jgi:exoribonuclease R